MRTLVLVGSLLSALPALASETPPTRRPMHPPVALLDAEGQPVIRSRGPVSTLQSCGKCHDTDFIAAHSYHAAAGADRPFAPGKAPSGRPWDVGTGLFGRWDALGLGTAGPEVDLKAWLASEGARHVGGGPATALGVEMNCFLCHLPGPDNAARLAELREGRYRWAATATLASAGVAKRTESGWEYDPDKFDADGRLTDTVPRPRATTAANCGLCHGTVHQDPEPMVLPPGRSGWSTETKGQVYSAQRLKDSGLNLKEKDLLARPFDVHAERLLECADCHTTANNPAQFAAVARTAPRHLTFEPRRLAPGEYLARPDHNLAKGHAAQGTVAWEFDGTMRRCEQCHDAEPTHDWLPYPRRHFQAMNCEACHVPQVFGPAREQTDWTVVGTDGQARVAYRGAEGDPGRVSTLQHGFQPVLLPREELDGTTRLTPHNLVASWYWVAGDPLVPVPRETLARAFLEGGRFRPEIVGLLDTDRDGQLAGAELRLDTPAKADAIRDRLVTLGVKNPRIRGEVQPYGLHHGVATETWAVRRCSECHGPVSRVGAPMVLAEYLPGGVVPVPVADANVRWEGRMEAEGTGQLVYRPSARLDRVHVIGRDRWVAGDAVGLLAVAGAVGAVAIHGGLRIRAARKAR